jgi:hypothetical protein
VAPGCAVDTRTGEVARQPASVASIICFELMMIVVLDSLLRLRLSRGARRLASIRRGR